MSKQYTAVNWNTPDNDYALMFWEQNIKQFWIDTEYIPSKDIDSWKGLSWDMKECYKKALGGLTLLDTLQSHTGMPKIIDHITSLQNKAVLSYMCMMEAIHAKSYSTIFTTVSTTNEINDVFGWVSQNKFLQYKASTIDQYYRAIDKENPSDEELFMALGASVLLESFLFYSGFFLPLWLCGQGQMVASADIIKKIVADESIHGVFVGLIAQEVFAKLPNKEEVKEKFLKLLNDLYENEIKYTEELYTVVGLTSEVKEYVRYNGNKALMNLGFEPIFDVKQVNPIVLNGLNTDTTQHDFFSKKSTNYEKATEIVHLMHDDFDMDASVDI
ncbi:class 1b ribonucleoside-diphosphate reductase subunit beta [Sphingobacterium litopenaei]|uniref:Ribonucleoside-diphosphate reductase subunit beta n=1 Tax=Sphingobacterium litopenaei TaxID=2763500 RepID=A0ABR7YBM7_9SPHI|nr:class 1b ribonucleoside-diphosphate reductase subunit beta [Sphingobacterium litopenaei]MBD1428700.1 class 1b ribonucleoside-diphosphate reductase subunit beta [Sphingobacterium litopenaei]